jgi:hypothetical protein
MIRKRPSCRIAGITDSRPQIEVLTTYRRVEIAISLSVLVRSPSRHREMVARGRRRGWRIGRTPSADPQVRRRPCRAAGDGARAGTAPERERPTSWSSCSLRISGLQFSLSAGDTARRTGGKCVWGPCRTRAASTAARRASCDRAPQETARLDTARSRRRVENARLSHQGTRRPEDVAGCRLGRANEHQSEGERAAYQLCVGTAVLP